MDYEKAYKEALERARKFRLPEDLIITEDIFPELKESEDEKIRKTIIDFLKNIEEENESSLIFGNTTTTDMIAWLEKQDSTDKINEKLRQYREYLIKETESWHKKEEDETLSKIGRQDCIGHANAYVSARSEFEDIFNYDSWSKKTRRAEA